MPHLQSIIEKCLKNKKLHTYSDKRITLQDILLAMGNNNKDKYTDIAITHDGKFIRTDGEITQIMFEGYDLTKSPYDQEESVLEFISKNI